MKDHHEYEKIGLGYSDIAQLVLRSPDKLYGLDFGGDGDYSAYLVDEDCAIPESYKLRFEAKHWIMIYDDVALRFQAYGEFIRVYSRGEFGCIIQIIK